MIVTLLRKGSASLLHWGITEVWHEKQLLSSSVTRKAQEESPAQCHLQLWLQVLFITFKGELCLSAWSKSRAWFIAPPAHACSFPVICDPKNLMACLEVILEAAGSPYGYSESLNRPVLGPVCSSHILIWKLWSAYRGGGKWKDARKTDVGLNSYGLIFLLPFRHNGGTCTTAQQHHRLHHWCDPYSLRGGSNVLHLPEGAVPTHEGGWGNHDQWLCGARASLGTSGLCASPKLSVRVSPW